MDIVGIFKGNKYSFQKRRAFKGYSYFTNIVMN